ncbi:MAG: hypothetical protein AB2705_18520 [Candidatus Thiodiazotropha sp.]
MTPDPHVFPTCTRETKLMNLDNVESAIYEHIINNIVILWLQDGGSIPKIQSILTRWILVFVTVWTVLQDFWLVGWFWGLMAL